MTSFSFSTRPADPRLRPWIRGCWEFFARDGAPPAHHVPPDGTAFLVLIEPAPRLVAFGPHIEPLIIPTAPGVRYRGLHLAPEAAPLLVGVKAGLLLTSPITINRLGPVDADSIITALRSGSADTAAAAIDQLFLPVVGQLPTPDPVAAAALQLIQKSRGAAPLAEVARATGVSERTLLRRIKTATGLTPKQHSRIARFFAAAHGMLDPDHRLSGIAALGGYADQPHFHHEVTALTGLTPAQLAQRVRQTEHRLNR
ncbi:MAG TPA: AraC family transcriptional regulator [Gemmatimonadales bacterium]|nr:AraC family transcriptional regulator [Gemmatimonadales bacterium]